jgi:hypothetical protein
MVKPGNYNERLVDPLPNGAILRGSDSAPANWPSLKPQNNVIPHQSNAIRITQARTSTITFKYFIVDLSSITSGNRPQDCWGAANTAEATPILIEDFACIGPAKGMTADTGGGLGVQSNWTVRRGSIKNFISGMDHPTNNPGAHGIYWQGSNSLVEHLWIENVNGTCVNFRSTRAGVSNNTFRYNVCKETQGGGPRGNFGSAGTNNKIHNNLIWNAPYSEIRDSNQIFANNTFWGTQYGRCLRLEGSGHTVRNNIFLNCGGTAIVNNSSGSTVSHNLISGTATSIFTDHVKGDFSLKAGSPAINAGTSVSGIVCNGTCDQGALEYGLSMFQSQSSNSQPLVAAPGNLQATTQ